MGILETTTTLIYLEYDQKKFNCSQMSGSAYIWSTGLKVIKVDIYIFSPLCCTIKTMYTHITERLYKSFSPGLISIRKRYICSSAIMPLYYPLKEGNHLIYLSDISQLHSFPPCNQPAGEVRQEQSLCFRSFRNYSFTVTIRKGKQESYKKSGEVTGLSSLFTSHTQQVHTQDKESTCDGG